MLADLIDIDLMYPQTNPIDFFCCVSQRPQDEAFRYFALDKQKRVCDEYDIYGRATILSELCEKLISDQLFAALPEQGDDDDMLVKICSQCNYNELVRRSNKDIELIIGNGEYDPHEEYGPNYNEIAQKLKDSNVDIVYIDGDKNYTPFVFNSNPTIVFISAENKDDFAQFYSSDTQDILEFIKKNLAPYGKIWRQSNISRIEYKEFTIRRFTTIFGRSLSKIYKSNEPQQLQFFV